LRNQSRWAVSVSVGAAFPVGKFAGKDFADSTQSTAITGLALNLQLHYRLCAHFGVGLLLTGQDDHVDTRSIEQQMEEASHADAVGASSGSWKIGKIMAGPTLSLPIGKDGKWTFTARLMAGMLRTTEPAITLAEEWIIPSAGGLSGGSGVIESISYQGKKSLSWAFSYLGGAGLAYRIDSRWSLRLDIDYAAASVKIPFSYYHREAANSGPPVITTGTGTPSILIAGTPPPPYSLPIASVNATAGLEFRF